MSLRARFVLALVGLVAVATALIGAFSYRTTRAELLGQLDSSLQATTADLRRPGGVDRVLGPRSPASIRGDSDVIVQVVGADGTVYSMDGAAPLPVGVSAEDLLDEPEGTFRWQDDSVDGTAVRVLTTSLGGGRGVLRRRELEQAGKTLSDETGRPYRATATGENVAGVYRQRVIVSHFNHVWVAILGCNLIPMLL